VLLDPSGKVREALRAVLVHAGSIGKSGFVVT
jgi:hypothetical protein